jgi:tyrosinase
MHQQQLFDRHISHCALSWRHQMTSPLISRRNFIKGSTSTIALASFPGLVLAQTTPRLEWREFMASGKFDLFHNTVRAMRANTNSSSPLSWAYWVNAHVNYCPHGTAYFLAWHRGYLYHFEQQLRTVSKDSSLALPYWDYYKYSRLPAEFTNAATSNALYVPRAGTDVYSALSLAPFSSTVVNFQRGTSNAFETSIESRPHNPVHNLIGREMANMTSPRDPIFFLHHGNIDRLWNAWVRAGGKRVPAISTSYWAGTFRYGSTMTIERVKTYAPGSLNTSYADNTQPRSLPPTAKSSSPFKLAQATFRTPPATRNFPARAARTISATRRSLGGVSSVILDESSVSARLPVKASDVQAVQSAVSAALSPPAQLAPTTDRSVKVILEDLQLLGAGANGGYFYNIYINLPDTIEDGQKYLLGTVGPFEIAGASHHGRATLEFPATEVLSKLSTSELQGLTVSFERINGENAPRGQTLRIGEIRIEISSDAPWEPN